MIGSCNFPITSVQLQLCRLIKTITKFSNVIGYQQPDLSVSRTVARVILVIGQSTSFCARCCGARALC